MVFKEVLRLQYCLVTCIVFISFS